MISLSTAHGRFRLPGALLMAIVGALVIGLAALQPGATRASTSAPAPALHWKACTGPGQAGYDCATFQVPLDYSQPLGKTIQLAVIRHRASDPAHRIGSLFFNPGGPGGPGTVILPLYLNEPVTTAPVMFPLAVRQRFDIISWDPRGVGASTAVQCFPTKQAEAAEIAKLALGFPVTLAQKQAWIKGWAFIGQQCAKSPTAYLLPHVSTADTARDLDLLRRAVGDETLSYQGNSYGTLLGAVYANLFPDKVRAMVLLGNDEPVGYTNLGKDNPALDTSLRQGVEFGTADTLNAFLERCGQVSTSQCAFSAGSAAATRAKWSHMLDNLLYAPVTAGGIKYDYDLVLTLTVVSLYEVAPGFIGFDWQWLGRLLQGAWVRSDNPYRYPQIPGSPGGQQATQLLAVVCAEAPNPRDPNAYFTLADLAAKNAGAVGPYWVWRDEECAQWPARAAAPYNGPFNKPTAAPILVVNNTHDPATPYSEAITMTKTLANARLLTIDGYGHADAAVPSTCADAYVSAYFIDGALPPKNTVCKQDAAPFTG